MGVTEIVLDGPGMNALGSRMMSWIRQRLREADGGPVLFRGEGEAFSAGLNLKEVTSLDREGMVEFLALLDEMVRDLYMYPGPTVALVNGHAIAGGCVLALCCDERIAPVDGRGKIGLNEVALGVTFPPNVMALVLDRIPRRHQERVLLGAELHPVDRALALGLLDQVAEDAPAHARERVERLASHPVEAYAAAKLRLRRPAMNAASLDRSRWESEEMAVWWSERVRSLLRARLER